MKGKEMTGALTKPAISAVIALLGACGIAQLARAAQDNCVVAEGLALKRVQDSFNPKIELFLVVSKALQDKGFDPRRFPIIMPDGTVEPLDMVDALKNLAFGKVSAFKQIEAVTQNCNMNLAAPEKITDAGDLFATDGLVASLPPKFKHVDVSLILSGHPFGGPNALVPNVRDDILKGLGIGGEVAKVIRNPMDIFRF
jgi:hypothetical protein